MKIPPSASRRLAPSVSCLLLLLLPSCGADFGAIEDLKPYVVEATASTSENRHFTAEFAFDGDPETRWSSEFRDGQWILARFAHPCRISGLTLVWEDACPREYTVEVSSDQANWTTVAKGTREKGGADSITLVAPVEASYVRVNCLRRATEWGNSLFEIEIVGQPSGPRPEKSLIGFEPPPTPWDKRCREIRDRLMAAAAADPKTSAGMTDDQFLELVSRRAFDFFWHETNPENGLTLDQAENFRSSEKQKIASVANAGYALSAYAIGAKRGWVTRAEAIERVRTTLRFFLSPKMKHVQGFYYHFLDMFTAELDGSTELSSIDSALFLCGVITAQEEFRDDSEVVELADRIIERMNWRWMLNGHPHFPSHGATQEGKFLDARWGSTTEGMICYLVGIGAPRHPMPAASWGAFDRHTGEYKGFEPVIEYGAQSIFRFQYPCLWYDFRNRHDGFCDYFENGAEATLAMRQYCIDQARSFPKSYGPMLWGLGAANGPGDRYYIYGFPPGGDPYSPVDGTVVIYAIAGSVPFVPELAIPALRFIYDNHHESWGKYGFTDAINPTLGIVTRRVVGLDQGTVLLAIENYRSGFVWDRFMRHPLVKRTTAAIGWTATPSPDPAAGPLNLSGAWRFRTGDGDFAGASVDDASWKTLIAPDRWENQDAAFANYDGVAWYRTTFELTAERLAAWRGQNLVFHVGAIDDDDASYLNGVKIGETSGENAWRRERIYTVPIETLKEGRNTVAIRVSDGTGFGGVWRRPLRIGPLVPAEWQPVNRAASRVKR